MHVAVKFPQFAKHQDMKCVSALANELQILRHARHPHLVLLHGACIDVGTCRLALVFEWVRGVSLRTCIQETDDISAEHRHKILVDVCCALRYLHALSPCVIHGDVKPENILVEAREERPHAKLLDFGLSTLLTKNSAYPGGTLVWMAPEVVLKSSHKPGPGIDVFSFGYTAYFVVTAMRPHISMSAAEVRAMHYQGYIEPLSWPCGVALCNECRALCEETQRFEAKARPNMVSVHGKLLEWVPPLNGRMQWAAAKGTALNSNSQSRGVGWDNGLEQLQEAVRSWPGLKPLPSILVGRPRLASLFAEQVFAILFNVFDAEYKIIEATEAWTDMFGRQSSLMAIPWLADMDFASMKVWLQDGTHRAMHTEESCFCIAKKVRDSFPDGRRYKGNLVFTFPAMESSTSGSSNMDEYIIILSLQRLRVSIDAQRTDGLQVGGGADGPQESPMPARSERCIEHRLRRFIE
eukprot:gnl/TRDRNA2_/TRDRNA2_170447_c1_seq2.p1 gnl/TRDRNA2_/TRDRNA2_170447_c1~~gnl/TRDRNA2_/TRDRNA2_170447_c1_seq2.p1  ORF type:complete len:522 (+),score=63.98 gnl/TRDRNA2_/TRDRNA2_170447_c1_seq2:173-1567(+)